MAEHHEQPEKVNGVTAGDKHHQAKLTEREERLYRYIQRLSATIVVPDPNSSAASTPLLQRIKIFVSENGPQLPEACKNTGRHILLWTRSGSHFRALLVISAGTITLLTLTGLLVFMLFFLAATVNAIVISLLVSLAAAGGFLALFFTCVTAIYIGALSVAVVTISTVTISAIAAALIATGWIGFFWTVWLATKKSVGLAKHSLSMTGSALSASSSGCHTHHHDVPSTL